MPPAPPGRQLTRPAVPARRAWWGLGVAVAGLAALTATLAPARVDLSLASVALLFLVPVVAAAVIGGLRAALAGAIGADLVVNFFFVPPLHTFAVDSSDHVIVLVVYVVVAVAVSVAVEIAARHRAHAARGEAEVALLARAAAAPVAGQSLDRLLEQIRTAFAMTAVALLERDDAGERAVATTGRPPPSRPTLSASAGDGLRLVAWGPPIVGDDGRTLTRLAAAAARTLEAQRLSDQATRARDLAEIDRVRSALLVAVGHDLRTPLAATKAAVSSLRQPDLHLTDEDTAELLATIEEATDRLDALVDNLLSMSRLQAGVLSVHAQPVALDAVVAQALRHVADREALTEVDIPDDLPLVHADPGLLERVVANLVSNARAASGLSGSSIRLHGRAVGDSVLLHVIDHGPGIPPADRERIFEPFQRLHDRTTTTGLGLGLAIARGFTDAMHAAITAEDTPGGGTTMTVRLPTEAVAAALVEEATA